jgi:hypothetical protein
MRKCFAGKAGLLASPSAKSGLFSTAFVFWLRGIKLRASGSQCSPTLTMKLACLAYQAKADYVVTHNLRHFKEIEKLKIQVVTPKDFLPIIHQSK